MRAASVRAIRHQHQTARQIVITSGSWPTCSRPLCEKFEPEKALAWTLGPISSNWIESSRLGREGRAADIGAVIEADVEGKMTDTEAAGASPPSVGEAEQRDRSDL